MPLAVLRLQLSTNQPPKTIIRPFFKSTEGPINQSPILTASFDCLFTVYIQKSVHLRSITPIYIQPRQRAKKHPNTGYRDAIFSLAERRTALGTLVERPNVKRCIETSTEPYG